MCVCAMIRVRDCSATYLYDLLVHIDFELFKSNTMTDRLPGNRFEWMVDPCEF